MIKQVQERRDEAEGKKKRRENGSFIRACQHMCVCLWRCQQIGDTLDKILSNRSCSPRSGQTAVSKSYHTHTLVLELLLWPWQTAWKAQIKKPIMLPPSCPPRDHEIKLSEQQRETKRESKAASAPYREPESLFKCLSESVDVLQCMFLSVNHYPAGQMHRSSKALNRRESHN